MTIIVRPPAADLCSSVPPPANGAARLHHRFLLQAVRAPDAVALVHDGRDTSYRALDQRSNRIAHLLRGQGIGPGDRVGICLERSPDLVAALLAVLKAGAAYVPLDPSYPRQRLEQMLADSDPPVLIGMPGGPAFAGVLVTLAGNPALDAAPSTPLADPDDDRSGLACIFYTSGSTGQPKGVMLGHHATRFIDWAEHMLGRHALARVAATTSICFDPSIFEIFATLSLGGTVILKRDLLEPFAADEQPTLLNGVPSAFAELARENRIPDSVRVINVGGERLSAALARLIHDSTGNRVQLWNHYGPTETTICASVALVPAGIDADPSIGQPIAGAVFHVLDPEGQPVAPGDDGELHIGGPNLALGYLGRPELTAERFLPDPFQPGERLYRTGDIVRATADGALVFLGREGRQIKLHGFRIELDDIEAAVSRLAGIDAAATVATRDADGRIDGIRAVIAVAAADGATNGDWTLSRLRRSLRDSLPRHMLPNQLAVLRALPLTPSGKLDRPALERLERPAPAPLAVADPWMPPLAEAVLTIFRDVLERPSLGPDDDFFDHGGDSLMAMDVLLRLETLLGEPMPAGLMAGEASAVVLAGLVSRRLALLAAPEDGARAILLQPEGCGAPLFCLAESAARPLQALALAYHLRGDRPVWSLTPSRGGSARDHLATLRDRSPDQALHLLASGATAADALALAAGLEQAGRAVVLVLVAPLLPPDARRGWQRLRDGVRRRLMRTTMPPTDTRSVRTRTILLATENDRRSGQVAEGRTERIMLPLDGDPLRAPAVRPLADALRICLARGQGSPAAAVLDVGSRAAVAGPVGDR